MIDKAIAKHGKGAFGLTIIASRSDTLEIDALETYWIAKMRAILGKKMVYNHLNGQDIPSQLIEFSATEQADIVSAYSNGSSARVIGMRYNCTPRTIKRVLLSNGQIMRTISESLKGKVPKNIALLCARQRLTARNLWTTPAKRIRFSSFDINIVAYI
jgi:hypothetical protein